MTQYNFARTTLGRQSDWTKEIPGHYGNFSWLNSSSKVHYVNTISPLSQLTDDVKLLSEIPDFQKWGFETLVQRNLDETRVDDLGGYIGQDKLHFFPPITVALLPAEKDRLLQNYRGSPLCKLAEVQSDQPDEQIFFTSIDDGLQLTFSAKTGSNPKWPDPLTMIYLKWDRSKFIGLVIDGQHRLKALKERKQSVQDAFKEDFPVTFIIFDTAESRSRYNLIEAARSVFIDINKNAVQVDASRLILLDDHNLCAGITRKLIQNAYTNTFDLANYVYEAGDEKSPSLMRGLPSELVNLVMGSEASDVRQLWPWQFTSVYILNRAVQFSFLENDWAKLLKILNQPAWSKKPQKSRSKRVVETEPPAVQIDAYKQHVNDIQENIRQERVDLNDFQSLVSFPPPITKGLVEHIYTSFDSFLFGVFTSFSPYRERIEALIKINSSPHAEDIKEVLISIGLRKKSQFKQGDNEPWIEKISEISKDNHEKKRVLSDAIEKISKPSDWEEDLVWYSVFQRALLFQPLAIKGFLSKIDKAGQTEDKNKLPDLTDQSFASLYIGYLNKLYDAGVFSRSYKILETDNLWEGIVVRRSLATDELKIVVAEASVKRLAFLIRVLVGCLHAEKYTNKMEIKANVFVNGKPNLYNALVDAYAKMFDTQAMSDANNIVESQSAVSASLQPVQAVSGSTIESELSSADDSDGRGASASSRLRAQELMDRIFDTFLTMR
jgi:DGQHR domain-containing protein